MYLDGVEREGDKPLATGRTDYVDLQSAERNESGFECDGARRWSNVVQIALRFSNCRGQAGFSLV